MEKEYYGDAEKIDDDIEKELTKEQLELLEIEKEQSTEVRNGQVEFTSVNHSERANKFGRASDGDITEYANIALEYFGHRCALSGERFVSFDEKVNGKKQNLSAEHVVALCLGGDDVVPNIVPTVLQYNLRKNGYYLLDYWDKQKDIERKSLYSPYRLLKLVNYMMKSIDARGLDVEEYYKSIMTPNEIDRFLEEIEKQDDLEPDNSKKKIYSEIITATTLDEDNKKILTEIPSIEGNIPTLGEQQEKHTEIKMMDIFLSDAVGVLKREQDLQQVVLQDKDGNEISLQDKLDEMLEKSIKEIRFEVEVRNAVLESLETLGIENNKYSVANDLIRNSEILDLAKESPENVNNIVEEFLEKGILNIDLGITNEQKIILISSNPALLYNRNEIEEIRVNIERYKRYIGEDIDFEILSKPRVINALEIRAWMEQQKTIKPPSSISKDKEEKRLGTALSNIRQDLMKPYMHLKTEEEKRKFKQKHPGFNKITEIVKWIDENNVSPYLINAREIKKWMEERETTKPPSSNAKDKEEKSLGQALSTIRQRLIKPYTQLKNEEEIIEFKEHQPDIEEIVQIVKWIDENNISHNLANARKIKKWMQEHKTTKPPSAASKDKDEKTLGTALTELRRNLIKPYKMLKTEDERMDFLEKYPEIEDVLQIISWIDANRVNTNLVNMRDIKIWMEVRKTTKPPTSNSKDKEEKRLGKALQNIRQTLIKTYVQLETEQEKIKFEQEHPKLKEILEIINWIDENNISPYLINARDIKKWVEENQSTKLPSMSLKVGENERELAKKLSYIRQDLIGEYMKLKTEQKRTRFREKHPEIDEVMSIISQLDMQYGNAKQKEIAKLIVQDLEKRAKKKVKEAVVEQKNKGELGQNQQIEEDVFEETIRQAEQTKESEVAGR